ncbi:MAG: hypothetical protein A3C79_01080 [Candidatus Taylorbacteria bacterium RIFCSPHIGHO2_02_FULL_45_28]|uniref:Uncharacterized protein n=1 Tax=Candidatus Taylorbacteria bacterium RIFCSPHIGHO2_12_FULL_45_16 TaxID=1802315 RepID=A0A1G2N1M3_9BACT|nr:MAG: hypothetical protein A2830_02330 [Candidatus Taylorbacteria bacterium RIFCSPHIGHO2_01_FULL_44_110]OHA25613.1 MAG: hypothetical protein A3C79_01080 [Candidatus Taylorbacteria bacterium RIFCSPHIGHO2_02_FULL_45_28]OHA29279.1 MAG: hypothetical protein A3F51_01545 [Candidatus Taylorbacteria bacterium RIFCSPHIGHO2_12_FULL_45_16]OHA33501.1 MAG: hypothetical protein A3A23_02425 [Candidatus Taylorbacteria bacterium RIFCSPLOWO2_01_FULL_45_59]OHA44377.1 MAG: hypothetical protein A3G04_02615 [Candi
MRFNFKFKTIPAPKKADGAENSPPVPRVFSAEAVVPPPSHAPSEIVGGGTSILLVKSSRECYNLPTR